MTTRNEINVQELERLEAQGDLDLIDVRTPLEYREVHAVSAKNIPLEKLNPHIIMSSRKDGARKPLYVICKGGARGTKAQKKFVDAGFPNVVNVEGGTDAWISAKLPVVRGKKAISLERQVRIVAGMLVFAGALLALILHPLWAVVPAFIGLGLTFAGITDWCGMGMLIAKMPWNQVNGSESCCTTNSN